MKRIFKFINFSEFNCRRHVIILFAFFSVILFIQAQCGNINRRDSSNSSAISICVKYNVKPKFASRKEKFLNAIYFIRLDKSNRSLYSQNKYIRSNYNIMRRTTSSGAINIFLLNAKPGRYAAIGGFLRESESRYGGEGETEYIEVFFFPKKMIPLTVVDIGPSEIKHMGDFIIDNMGEPQIKNLYKIRNADSAQLHYCRLIKPDSANPTAGSCTSGCLFSYLDSFTDSTRFEKVYAAKMVRRNKSRRDVKKAFRRSIRQLSGSEWAPLLVKEAGKL